MGEKWWPNGAWDMHPGFFYMPQICDMGLIILLPFRRKACWGILSPFKNPTASARFEPANLGLRGQHTTSAPPKPNYWVGKNINIMNLFTSCRQKWNLVPCLDYSYVTKLICHPHFCDSCWSYDKHVYIHKSQSVTGKNCDTRINKYRISRPIRRTVIFSLEILEKNNDECILILVIYWKKTGLLQTKISNHNIIYSS